MEGYIPDIAPEELKGFQSFLIASYSLPHIIIARAFKIIPTFSLFLLLLLVSSSIFSIRSDSSFQSFLIASLESIGFIEI